MRLREIAAPFLRFRASWGLQVVVVCTLSAFVGFTLQFTKLTAIDSSGREFDQSTYTGKVGFLAVFGFSKAFANLSVGWLVLRVGYTRTELAGWLVGLAMPLAAMGATPGKDGWAAIMAANVALGLQQGLCWSVTVLAMILLLPTTRRGLASGLNETLGYTAVAAAAPVYGALESGLISCSWTTALANLSPACLAASLLPGAALPGGAAAGAGSGAPSAGGAAGAAGAGALDPLVCTSPDTWSTACLGECRCTGYSHMLTVVLAVLVPSGLLLSLLMVEPRDACGGPEGRGGGGEEGAGAEGGGDEEGGEEGERRGLLAGSAEEGRQHRGGRGAGAEVEVELGPYQGLAPGQVGAAAGAAGGKGGGRWGRGAAAAKDGERYRALPDAAVGSGASPGGGGAGPSPGAGLGAQAWGPVAGGEGLGGAGGAELPSVLPVSKSALSLASGANATHGSPPAAGEWGSYPYGSNGTAEKGVADPGVTHGSTAGGGGGGTMAQQARQLLASFVHYTWENPSTAAMCTAGVVSNLLTSLAWGLLLTWARDELGVPGAARNLLAAAYSFLKGLVQLFSGLLSDAAGRKWLVVCGLALNAAGLMTAAFGAGFDGALLGPDVTPGSLPTVQFGYLLLGSCLMGSGGGLMYPVMAAAVADHARAEHTLSAGMSTYRFWRDLGYAVGALGGPLADWLGVEAAALTFSGVCLGVATLVGVRYKERPPGSE